MVERGYRMDEYRHCMVLRGLGHFEVWHFGRPLGWSLVLLVHGPVKISKLETFPGHSNVVLVWALYYRICYFGCLIGISISFQVFHVIETVLVLALIILK